MFTWLEFPINFLLIQFKYQFAGHFYHAGCWRISQPALLLAPSVLWQLPMLNQLRPVTDEQHVRIMRFTRLSPLSHFGAKPRTFISYVRCFISQQYIRIPLMMSGESGPRSAPDPPRLLVWCPYQSRYLKEFPDNLTAGSRQCHRRVKVVDRPNQISINLIRPKHSCADWT